MSDVFDLLLGWKIIKAETTWECREHGPGIVPHINFLEMAKNKKIRKKNRKPEKQLSKQIRTI